MRYYPICLDIKGRPCLVVGGGRVGTRKTQILIACGALVTVVSPRVTPTLSELATGGAIALINRPYRRQDLAGRFLVIVATDDEALNRRVSRDAEKRNLLCNVVDRPELCSFILPAVVSRGDLMITVSTSGASPALAKHLRQQLELQFGEEYARVLSLLGNIRGILSQREHAPAAHKRQYEQLLEGGLLELLKDNRREDIDRLLARVLGQEFSLDTLLNSEG